MSQRFEMRLSDDLAERIDEARGDLPRATWMKRALEKALGDGREGSSSERRDSSSASQGVGPVPPASPRAPKKERLAQAREVVDGPAPPKIAPKHWAR